MTITGNPETIKVLAEKKLDFEHFFPTPKDAQDPIEWRYENWGTKWTPHEYSEKVVGVRGMRVAFDTAWSPPSKFFEKLLKVYPDLWIKCEWHEEGGLAGVWVGNAQEIKELSWADLCLEEEYYAFKKEDEE